ncbi:unnamed protein product [Darwinula stevensoni]|uniref:Uncharacterized protein n=1 Tax=Darwinula stevensoni TaxID=69355 RepID=A0A7R9FQ62_9CRUS|nr:unnamed protein product [Darwinula stevensoni]CAG0899144.1 unnamed protein product [Darwinula stevensoni]
MSRHGDLAKAGRRELEEQRRCVGSWGVRTIIRTAIIISTTALAIVQVQSLVSDYMSFPTNTLYLVEEKSSIPSPAITICPKYSISRSRMAALNLTESDFSDKAAIIGEGASRLGLPQAEFFDLVRLELLQLLHTTYYWNDLGGKWSQRTFYSWDVSEFYECFTLTVPVPRNTGPGGCNENCIILEFKNLLSYRNRDRPNAEVYIHEAEEPYSELPVFGAVQILIHNDSTTEIFLTPELMEFQDKSSAPCTRDSNHSYIKCVEECFFGEALLDPDVECVVTILLPPWKNWTTEKPECGTENQWSFLEMGLYEKRDEYLGKCGGCKKRCTATEYAIVGKPTPSCGTNSGSLMFSFPSKKVGTFQEQPAMSLLALLSNIGGILGLCLGISLLNIYDLFEDASIALYNRVSKKYST